MPSVCPLLRGQGSSSSDEPARSYLTAKFLPSKQLLAVLSSIEGKGECQVFFVAALPLEPDFSVEDAAQQSPTWQPPPAVDLKLVHSLRDDALISGGAGGGRTRAFWHSIAEPNWDFLYLVVFSTQQCQLVIIPGDVVEVRANVFSVLFCVAVFCTRGGFTQEQQLVPFLSLDLTRFASVRFLCLPQATGSDRQPMTVTPFGLPPSSDTLVIVQKTDSYRKGEVCVCVCGFGCPTAACAALCVCRSLCACWRLAFKRYSTHYNRSTRQSVGGIPTLMCVFLTCLLFVFVATVVVYDDSDCKPANGVPVLPRRKANLARQGERYTNAFSLVCSQRPGLFSYANNGSVYICVCAASLFLFLFLFLVFWVLWVFLLLFLPG